jgi:uncharacterized protein YjbI with pentapeptide repeats
MANPEHLAKLKKSLKAWNMWRFDNPNLEVDLCDAELSGANLIGANLSSVDLSGANLNEADLSGSYLNGARLIGAKLREADLTEGQLIDADLRKADLTEAKLNRAKLTGARLEGADLSRANLFEAYLDRANLFNSNLSEANLIKTYLPRADFKGSNLSGAELSYADLSGAFLSEANLSGAHLIGANLRLAFLDGANLRGADLSEANLSMADLSGADLTLASLSGALLVRSNLDNAVLAGCSVYGIAAWDLNLKGTIQSDLLITELNEGPPIRVDDLEVAQFIYLLLSHRKLRNVITTLGEKAVLILGRFTERKELLDRMADKLRSLGYLPMIFDFERPTDRDLTETVKILAGLSRFVIADITNPRSAPLELQAAVPDYMVPFVTMLQRGQPAFGMFDDLPRKYHWALPLLEYNSTDTLLAAFEQKVIAPALDKADEVRREKAVPPVRRSAEE